MRVYQESLKCSAAALCRMTMLSAPVQTAAHTTRISRNAVRTKAKHLVTLASVWGCMPCFTAAAWAALLRLVSLEAGGALDWYADGSFPCAAGMVVADLPHEADTAVPS